MALLKKTAPPSSLEERGNAAAALAGSAITLFQIAAVDLESAAEEQLAVAAEAVFQADTLYALADLNSDQADASRRAARRIRELVSA